MATADYSPGVYRFPPDDFAGSTISPTTDLIPCIVGVSTGADTTIANEEITRGVGDSDILGLPIVATVGVPATAISVVGQAVDVQSYLADVDYTLTDGKIEWLHNPMINPGDIEGVEDIGGTIGAGAYDFFVIGIPETSTLNTAPSPVFTITVLANAKISLRWGALRGASQYKVYGKPAASASTAYSLLATVETNSYIRSTPIIAGAIDIASFTNTSRIEPAATDDYFVTYHYQKTTFHQPRKYYTVATVRFDHGIGADVSVAAEFILDPTRGAGASAVWVVPVPSRSDASMQDGLTDAGLISDYIVVIPLSSSKVVHDSLWNHVLAMSTMTVRRYRTGICAPAIGTAIGDTDLPNSLAGMAYRFNEKRIVFLAPAVYQFRCQVQGTDGVYALTGVQHYMIAALVAGKTAALRDTAEPMTWKRVPAIVDHIAGTLDPEILGGTGEYLDILDETRKEVLRKAGAMVIEYIDGVYQVRHGITTHRATVEARAWAMVLTDDWLTLQLFQVVRPYIGKKNTGFRRQITAQAVNVVLDLAIETEKITAITEPVAVVQDTSNRTVNHITFKYEGMYEFAVAIMRFSYDTQSA